MCGTNDKKKFGVAWWREKLTAPFVLALASVITTILSGKFSGAIAISVCAYMILNIVVAAATIYYHKRYCDPEACAKAVDKINDKVSEQEKHISEVNNLIDSAKKLEKLYTDAVAKRLRTNIQVADIESRAEANSEIYIMTSGFLFERYDKNMRQSIAKNIIKGVKYRYIIPNSRENDFKQMLYAIMYEIQNNESFKDDDRSIIEGNNNFLTAVQIEPEYLMLTIAHYELNDNDGLSEVIVKLPADTIDEVTDKEALTYLVPKGNREKRHQGKDYNAEHKVFLENMNKIYYKAKEKELTFNKSYLMSEYRNGVVIEYGSSNKVKLR